MEKSLELVVGNDTRGFYDITGDTGKSATIWSLCKLRQNKKTLIVQLEEPYDYHRAFAWAGLDKDQVYILNPRERVLEALLEVLIESDVFGSVILEGLGFLLGSGKTSKVVNDYLGNISSLFKIEKIAKEKDIAIFTTSYNVYRPGIINKVSLGGNILLHLCNDKRLTTKRLKYYAPAGFHIAEKIAITNSLTSASCEGIIRYKKGPIEWK